jgi:hypothetical protein
MEITLKSGATIVCVNSIDIVGNSVFITVIGDDVLEEHLDDIKTITP